MLTVHPTLLIGPSDWQPDRMPRAEFLRRIDALWARFPAADRAIVYGNPHHHAELAYLTNLVPKLEASVAVLSRAGENRLYAGGGPNMIGAARPLTWIEDVMPLRDMGQAVRGDGEALLIGGGYMAGALHRTIVEALGARTQDATAPLWALMRQKSPAEIAAIREACATLRAAVDAIAQAVRAGKGVTAAVLAGEHAANERGAQDVRTLFSLNGGRTLQPFVALDSRVADPLQVYVAVRCFNYWAEGFVPLSAKPHAAQERAAELLRSTLGLIKGGTRTDEIASMVAAGMKPFRTHPVTEQDIAHSVGIALDGPLHTSPGAAFESYDVYSVAVGITDGGEQHAIVSAMIAVHDGGNEVLWSMAE